MHSIRKFSTRLLAIAVLAATVNFAPVRAHAVSKEIVELQTQVQQLLDMVQRLQSTMDSRFGVIQHLVEQSTDSANRMSAAVTDLQQKLASQNEAMSGKIDSSAASVQSLNDSVDELKSRVGKLQDALNQIQTQLQNAQPAPGGQGAPQGGAGQPGPGAQAGPAANAAPPLEDTFQAGVRDFNSAKYNVAQGEFQDIIQYYPNDDLAGQAQFYLGEIAYRQQDYGNAIKSYNSVLEGFPTSNKAPAAQLHKGLSLLAQNKRNPGIEELRALIRKHPQTPEAAQARTKLNGMGVKITASAPR
ncbi:tetratricopeptide repeat protein [Occallatibacter riparius]|uniref:Tetratricopeptide repeat protein n=1 Tax=Occallatibacter riparius TaxID=1002689 RepID=A0A9J7BHH1_9BACT|nr:tetratricopeptide repeat protein [Occallatibacter riparius]UWZ81867.1 tetratricopeptide repeat protein [Occallatibacter riparius]